jgi:hypothetical protein
MGKTINKVVAQILLLDMVGAVLKPFENAGFGPSKSHALAFCLHCAVERVRFERTLRLTLL